MSFDDITVVINTFYSDDKITNCLNSIPNTLKIIVIENSSRNDFKLQIEKKYPNVKCYLTGQNLGYAKGNNFGLSKVNTNYALILNPDAKLEDQTINNFLISASKVKDFAIIGPGKQDEFDKNKYSFPNNELFEVNYLKGFAMFLNLKEFEEIGYFDENFFIYLEETDLCKRIKIKNKRIFLDCNIKVSHIGGKSHSNNIDYEMELSRNWHWMWSTFYFHKKHKGFLYGLVLILPKCISAFLKFIFYSVILNKEKKEIYFFRLSGIINSILGKKSWYRPSID